MGVLADLNVIQMGARFTLGPFDLQYVTLTHSIPEPNAIAIRTGLGNVLHTGDWKIDPAPTLGPATDADALTAFGEEGVRAIVCDSTNVFAPGFSGSETMVRENLTALINEQKNRVVVTTFASNVSRVFSICEAARATGRSICLLGRSMLRIVGAARAVGLLPDDIEFVEPRQAGYIPREHILYLCTGSQGEPRAALARIARDDHPEISINEGDTVIFSSKIIPGNERQIYDLQDDLVDLGAHVITEKDADIHVSGHPNQDELRQMYEWAKPQKAIPVHGEARHLERHAAFARELGVEDALAPRNGDLVRIAPGDLEVVDEVPSGRLMGDGDLLLPEGASAIRERRKLSYAGVVQVSFVLDRTNMLGDAVMASIVGVPDVGASGDDLVELIEEAAEIAIKDLPPGRRKDDDDVEVAVRRAVRRCLAEEWGKRPVINVAVLRTS